MHTKLSARLRMDVECLVSKSGRGIRSGRVRILKNKMIPWALPNRLLRRAVVY